MIRLEALALAIGKYNGAWDDPDSRAFKLRNPGLLKTYRPEKKADSEHYRIFSSVMGGFKALLADMQAKCNGENHRLTSENSLKDLLHIYGFKQDIAIHKIVLFLRRALTDDNISANSSLGWFLLDSTGENHD